MSLFKTPSMPPPPAPPPPPPTPPHLSTPAVAKSASNYATMQRGGLAGTILTSAQGASDYATNKGGKSLLGQ